MRITHFIYFPFLPPSFQRIQIHCETAALGSLKCRGTSDFPSSISLKEEQDFLYHNYECLSYSKKHTKKPAHNFVYKSDHSKGMVVSETRWDDKIVAIQSKTEFFKWKSRKKIKERKVWIVQILYRGKDNSDGEHREEQRTGKVVIKSMLWIPSVSLAWHILTTHL